MRTAPAGILVVATILASSVSAAPLMVVTCAAPKGVNLASATEGDKPKESNPDAFDAVAGGYLSHPRDTHGSIITVNRDGTATETSFLSDGKAMVSDLRIVGKVNETAISFISGADGSVNLITLYPKESVVMYASTGYFGWHKGIPIGSVYFSHCDFSRVLQ